MLGTGHRLVTEGFAPSDLHPRQILARPMICRFSPNPRKIAGATPYPAPIPHRIGPNPLADALPTELNEPRCTTSRIS